MKNHRRSIEHHQSQANERIPRARKRKLMQPANSPVGEANRAPKRKLPQKPQILIKSIGRTWYWEYHGDGLDLEEMLVDVTAETASEKGEIRLVLDSRTQVEELITKLRGALAQESEEETGTPTDPNDKDELHELN